MLLDDLGDYLSTQGVGTVGTNIFLSILPSSPDTCVGLFETGGQQPMYTMAGGPVALMPTVQVVCRAKRYDVARLLANSVDKILSGLRNRQINGIYYRWIEAQQSPFFISQDENEREEIGCNYLIIRDSSSS